MKREAGDEPAGKHHHHKKYKHNDGQYGRDRLDYRRDDRQQSNGRSYQQSLDSNKPSNGPTLQKKHSVSHQAALDRLPPSTIQSAEVPALIPFNTPHGLPSLPDVKLGPLQTAPFKHKSLAGYDRTSSTGDVTYERLEFLGDAYIELIASRLIFERYPTLTAGQQSQLRELLVKNETLAEYSHAYGFDDKIEISAKEKMLEDVSKKHPGNKGFKKVMGDVFEAYVAAVIMSDVEHGFAVAEKWLTSLWAPKLLENAPQANGGLVSSSSADPLSSYNPEAKAQLQKRILSGSEVKLDYERYADSIELKGAQLGQNKHFIAVYLTGYGYEKKLLGKGEGRNKVEAGNWAAQRAMFGESKAIVEECEAKMLERREKRKKEREDAKAKATDDGKTAA